ncbi:bifunctional glutamate N-acetyltransferase/amino-acid acetyltransferase ArgJ [Roseibacillus persicicus]|uniref:Arginine biosynthesis bifunctional protein ArgJ n=1 Tax=Roseibacillus persicicus TaxID=454148 RepID=A0A918WIG1_9BACT|nr:bifunctional glutamate N-acetyltransferase/amino-acid acetyltransferase ArgJ [Roseibacillus persicicus]MDQ8192121.1 bifunctional glutamate N-acetyltransferase/amino-acid acetyltransferase ArgJ [Roseibacillus persicicus]GHC49274.1 arginine biosynthesis bifunctional protein ArgJ [Roseibacillus persicicus]
MPYQTVKGGVCAPAGFLASAVSAGIKNPDAERLDLALIYSEHPCVSSGTFTTNRVKAAPVRVSHAHLRNNEIRAIIANSGNANACTGIKGLEDARTMANCVAKPLKIRRREVGVCSTGVIGLRMPMERITPHGQDLVDKLKPNNGTKVAKAIMTSDTRHKELAITTQINGKEVTIGACVKGAGMICPSMATMLCFVTTDAKVSRNCLELCLLEAVEASFNRITIDGDMSTNDTVLALANGAAGGSRIQRNTKGCRQFRDALEWVLTNLAKDIVRDGERVTKFVTVEVKNARTYLDAKKVAEAVAKSQLVKASWNGNDPNWGRIIHAVGYSRAPIREELIDIYYEDLPACIGGLVADTPLDKLREIAREARFKIVVDLNLGKSDYTIYTSDLSPEYIDFNRSEYAYWNQARKEGMVE